MWLMLAWAVVSLVASYALTSSTASKAQKPVAGQLDIPTAEEGGSIPVCFGTNRMTQSNVTWYGDPSTKKIKSKGGKK